LQKNERMKTIAKILLLTPWLSLPLVAAEATGKTPTTPSLTAALPLRDVILYSSGVGYFERNGEVNGRTQIELTFKVDDINDLLKSLVVQDFSGGKVQTVTYESRDPITKTLRSFGVDLTENPTLGQLLNQVRGEQVEVLWPNPVTGTILGVEKKMQPVGEDKQVEVEYLNLLAEDGLQSIPLPQVKRIKLLNDRLNGELRQALNVLATGHDTQKKSVGITFDGEGRRNVSVSYITQTPVWKTSYRLVLDEDAGPFLQGWAIVENTSDEDWNNVRMSLVSGRPISFIMDLYQPLYTTRPVVEPELYSSLKPQVYGQAMEELKMEALAVAPQSPAPAADAFFRTPAEANRSLGRVAGAERAQRKRSLDEGVAAAAEGAVAGELFQYAITTPVTLARQKSAMLPIVSQKVEGKKVSIYNPNVQAKFPLNGFRLKNSTALHLMQGPITVFDANSYAGDARIDDLAPGQERLLSYALDLKAEVEPQTLSGRQDLLSVQIKKGVLVITRKSTEEKAYNVRNRDQKKKSVLIEHPFRSDWQLIEPKEPAERTRDLYRFLVTVDPGQTAKLEVREEKPVSEQVLLSNFPTDSIAIYLQSKKVSAKVKEALQKVVALRDRISQTAADRTRRETRVNEITQEQGRIRENMAKLNQNSELYTRYVKKLDEQETALESLRQEIEQLRTTEATQQKELNDYLLALDVE
jgi:hypothetical protein